MTCSKFRTLLAPWLDGELKPERANEVQAWFDSCGKVRHCSVCRKLADEYRSFHRTFQDSPQGEFPAFLHSRIMDTIKAREANAHKRAIRTSWQTVPVALAVILSLYMGSLVGVKTFSTQAATTSSRTSISDFGENGLVTTLYSNGGME